MKAIGILWFLVLGHHMYTVCADVDSRGYFAGITSAISVPTGVKIFSLVYTLAGGKINYKTPLHFAIGFILLFTV